MQMRSVPFSHKGKDHEVRVAFDGTQWNIQVFSNGVAASGLIYSVRLDVQYSLQQAHGISGIQELVDSAIRDFKDGLYERILAAHNKI